MASRYLVVTLFHDQACPLASHPHDKSAKHISASTRPLWILAGALFLLYALALALYLKRLPEPAGVTFSISLLLPTMLEMLAFGWVGGWLLQAGPLRGSWLRTLAYAFVVLAFTFANLAQTYALLISNAFISVLAMENAGEAFLTSSPWRTLMLLAGAAACAIVILCAWRGRATRSGRHLAPVWRGLLVFISIIVVVLSNAGVAVSGGMGRLSTGQSPVASLLRVGIHMTAPKAEPTLHLATAGEQVCGVSLVPGRYPFLRSDDDVPPLPFPAIRKASKPNVVVIFVEGESARLLETYGGHYPGLTPNISRMATQSMVVDDYYNHTAATFRGLQGQLTSGYPVHGGVNQGSGWMEGNAGAYEKRSYASLPKIFHRHGYESVFFSPHPPSDAMTSLARMIGFEQVYTATRSRADLLKEPEPMFGGRLTDHDQFKALTRFMQQRKSEQPFFVSLYSLGTHAFLNVSKDGVAYGDGSNASLNTLHNADAAFGRFYDYFMSSGYADNTLLILTVDHAHYPEPPYLAVAGKPYTPFFVDQVPMLIRAPWLQLPARYDVKQRTTLDFAPTVLQLLGMQAGRDSFLGHSLFDRRYDRDFSIAAIGSAIYAIYHGQVYSPEEIPAAISAPYAQCRAMVKLYYSHELSNTIFPSRTEGVDGRVDAGTRAEAGSLRPISLGAAAGSAKAGRCAFDTVNGSELKKDVPLPVTAGHPFIASGWVVDSGLHSPAQFGLLLKGKHSYVMDGQAGLPRPDVANALHAPTAGNAGFNFVVDPAGVAPGSYDVMTMLSGSQGHEFCETGKQLLMGP